MKNSGIISQNDKIQQSPDINNYKKKINTSNLSKILNDNIPNLNIYSDEIFKLKNISIPAGLGTCVLKHKDFNALIQKIDNKT